jgi:hypothetical protein
MMYQRCSTLVLPSAKRALAFNGELDSESELEYSGVNGNVYFPLAATLLRHTITSKKKKNTILLF